MTFKFAIDRKITTWRRDNYEVKAENEKEAIELMKKEFEDQTYEDANPRFIESQDLGWQEDMKVEENNGCATRELLIIQERSEKLLKNFRLGA